MLLLQSIEQEYEYQLDEESVFRFLLDNLEIEHCAMERVEFGLTQSLEVHHQTDVLHTTRLGAYRPNCANLHSVIRQMALWLWCQLKESGAYEHGRLVYVPVTENYKLESWRLSLQPLILARITEPLSHQLGGFAKWL